MGPLSSWKTMGPFKKVTPLCLHCESLLSKRNRNIRAKIVHREKCGSILYSNCVERFLVMWLKMESSIGFVHGTFSFLFLGQWWHRSCIWQTVQFHSLVTPIFSGPKKMSTNKDFGNLSNVNLNLAARAWIKTLVGVEECNIRRTTLWNVQHVIALWGHPEKYLN